MSPEHRVPDVEATLDEIRKELSDVAVALAGVGYEVQALVVLARAYVKHASGEDPLEGTLYAADELDFPDWIGNDDDE